MRRLGPFLFTMFLAALAGCQGSVDPGGSSDPSADAEPSCGAGETQCGTSCCGAGEWCDEGAAPPRCAPIETCADGELNQDETDVDCGGALCPACEVGRGCAGDEDCASEACTAGTCQLCRAGISRCFGNWVRECSADEASWGDVVRCDAASGYACNPVSTSCQAVTPVGNDSSTPTGAYYQYAYFSTDNSVFLGGADVDAFVRPGPDGDQHTIYVNRDGQHVDVYQVELLDTDGDGLTEPNQHPDNPDHPGPIEERVLTYLETYDVPIGGTHNNEMYVTADSIVFTRGSSAPGAIFEYDMATGVVTPIAEPPLGLWSQVLGYDEVSGRWYSAIPYERWVYSLDPDDNEWVLEFEYPSLSGDHSDGLEVVTDPSTGTSYVYVSDMTSDFIGQYRREADGTWVQENLFHYDQEGAADVEGMGFGALHHFWATNEGYGAPTHALYEIGGGDIDDYVIE